MRFLLTVMMLITISGCTGMQDQVNISDSGNSFALVGVTVASSVKQRMESGNRVQSCANNLNKKALKKLFDVSPIARDMGKWFLHGLQSRVKVPLKMGTAVTTHNQYSHFKPVNRSTAIAVGAYHSYDKSDLAGLHKLARHLGVDWIVILDLMPEFIIIEYTDNNTSIRPGILVKARFINGSSGQQVVKKYRYESDRMINDSSLAGACVKIRRAFEYYDSHLAGMETAVNIW